MTHARERVVIFDWSRAEFFQRRNPVPLELMPDIWERIVRGLGVLTVAGFLITAMTPLSNVLAVGLRSCRTSFNRQMRSSF